MDQTHLAPFHPFDLKPGAFRFLVFKGVYACTSGAGPDMATTWEAIRVRFSFLWRTGSVWIPLDSPVTFTFPKGCPVPAKYR